MAEPTGIKIVRIHNARTGAKDENEEWILINNEGTQKWNLSGWMITDQTATQQHVHIYKFPEKTTSGGSSFDPGERIYVFTGIGIDTVIEKPTGGGRAQFHFDMNRKAMVWNNDGDRVYLRNLDGTFATQPFPVP